MSSARRLKRDRAAAGRRLRNLDRDQRATILASFYDEDWPKVWRFRLRGTGRRESGAHAMVREVR
jgi:hypothetical protein